MEVPEGVRGATLFACLVCLVATAEPAAADGLMTRFGRGALIRRLQDGNAVLRVEAAEQLGRRADEDAVEALSQRVLIEGNTYAKRAMVVALGRIGSARALPVLLGLAARSADPVRNEAVVALGLIGAPQAIGTLADQLADFRVMPLAAEALARIGSPALPKLLELLRQEHSAEGAARALGALCDPRAVPALIASLSVPAPERRSAAAAALRAIGDPLARKALSAVARDDPDGRVRAAARQALEGLDPAGPRSQTENRPSGSFESAPPHQRVSEILEGGSPGALTRLIALSTRAGALGREALRGLALLTHPRSSMGSGQPSSWLTAHCGSRVVASAPTPAEELRAQDCAFALGALANVAVAEPLVRALETGDVALRREAAAALGRLGASEALLRRYGSERSPEVRAAILWALGDHPVPSAVPVLIAALTRETGAAAVNAAASAGAVGDPRLAPLLRSRATDADPIVRANVVLALGRNADADSVPILRSRLETDPHPLVRANAARALGMLPADAAFGRLRIAALTDADPIVRAVAADAQEAALSSRAVQMPRGEDVFRARFTDIAGLGAPGIPYAALLPDGRIRLGWSDAMGEVVIFDVPRGTTRLWLP